MAEFNYGVKDELCTTVDLSGYAFDIDDITLDDDDVESILNAGGFDQVAADYVKENDLLDIEVTRDDVLNWLKDETGCSFNTLTNMIAMLKAIQEDRMVGVIHLDEI